MKFLILAGAVVLVMASCSKKSNSPSTTTPPQGNSVSFSMGGQTVNMQDIVVDTLHDPLQNHPEIEITGKALLTGVPDSLSFQLWLFGQENTSIASLKDAFTPNGTYNVVSLDYVNTTGPSFSLQAEAAQPFTVNISTNTGKAITGTLSGTLVVGVSSYASGAGPQQGTAIAVTNGSFSLAFPGGN